MTQSQSPYLEFLRFQVGQMVERRPSNPNYSSAFNEPPVWLFHLRGFGRTREAAIAMAGLPSSASLTEELH